MDNSVDLKAIWQTAKTDNLPDSKAMVQFIKSFRKQKLRNKWLVIASYLTICCLITGVLIIVDFKLLTTYIGGGLMVLSSGLLAINNIKSIKRFNQLEDFSNLDFLAFIEQTRQNQIYYYKKTMVKTVLISSIGWMLYLYELVYQQAGWIIGLGYALAFLYLGVMWFVIRPRSFKKDAVKLEATKQRLENLLKQLKSYETEHI